MLEGKRREHRGIPGNRNLRGGGYGPRARRDLDMACRTGRRLAYADRKPTGVNHEMWRGKARRLVTLAQGGPWPAYLAHLFVACWAFGGLLFGGRVLFFRDLSLYYYPNYTFLDRSLAQGVWPVWNPMVDAGIPSLITDPVDLALVGIFGADAAMTLGPPILLFVAMCGATSLARQLGVNGWGSWTAGAFYGLSGALLSTVNLVELFHGASWAPWVVVAFLRFWNAPSPGRVAALALVGAVQIATLSAEVLLQTAAVGLALVPAWPRARHVFGLIGAGLVATLLAAPALLGARALVAGTAREAGFPHEVSFAWSAKPLVFLEVVFPHFFGDVHTMTNVGFWGQDQFPNGIPYLLSLYLGPAVLMLVAMAGRRGTRLYVVVVLGILLALGDSGPLEPLMAPWMKSLRVPLKFFLMSNLALCLLAGLGVDRVARRGVAARWWLAGPGVLMLLTGAVIKIWPTLPLPLVEAVAPGAGSRAALVIANAWPHDFLVTGVLALGAGLALSAGRRLVPLAAVLAVLDLAIVNESINTSAPADFYKLRTEIASQIAETQREGSFRWFSYGVAYSPGLSFSSDLLRRNSDVWLFYLDRQTLLARTQALDGFESALGLDRVGWSPPGTTLTIDEMTPKRFRDYYPRLRMANVRWVVSFHDLPEELVSERAKINLPEVRQPLRLFEARDPLLRAFWVGSYEVFPNPSALQARRSEPGFDPHRVVLLEQRPPPVAAGELGTASYRPLDPHTIRVHSDGAPGFIVVLDNFHPAWVAERNGKPSPLLRANGQYIAIPTPGGSQEITLRFRPEWRPRALVATSLGVVLTLALALAGVRERWRSPRGHKRESQGSNLPTPPPARGE